MIETITTSIWQPVLIISPRRLECACGARAIFVRLNFDDPNDGATSNVEWEGWCQDCWERETEGGDQ